MEYCFLERFCLLLRLIVLWMCLPQWFCRQVRHRAHSLEAEYVFGASAALFFYGPRSAVPISEGERLSAANAV